jgi:hypothetical protein
VGRYGETTPVQGGSLRVAAIASPKHTIAAGASSAKYAVPRPSAQCPAPRYQEGSLVVPRRVLVTDRSQIVDARASPAPTR